MKEKDYMAVGDLNLARAAKDILRMGNFFDEPNKTRYLSVMANLELMTANLFDEIEIEEEPITPSTVVNKE